MKKAKKTLAFLFAMVLCIGMMTMNVSAESTEQDGLEGSLTTDKSEYSQGDQITATLTVTNTNDESVSNITMENIIPDGYILADDAESIKEVESLNSGESVSMTVTYAASETDTEQSSGDNNGSGSAGNSDSSNSNNDSTSSKDNNAGKSNAQSPRADVQTGDNTSVAFWIAIVVIAGAAIVVTIFARKKKGGKKLLSLFLCLSLTGSLIPISEIKADAAEAEKSIFIEQNVTVGDSEITISALVSYDAEEYSETDTDADGAPDYIEEYFGTDVNKEDTDGDGLSDDIEINKIMTDPLNHDSDGNGISDADEDAGGVSNIEEINAGTDPTDCDTDSDGLSDADEMNVYGTDPIKYDTDEDGLSDGDEVLLGLDPLNPSTDGSTPDNERLFEQTLDEVNIEESLAEDNSVIPSISGNVPGNINDHVTINEIDVYALDDNRAAIGKHVYVETDYEQGIKEL